METPTIPTCVPLDAEAPRDRIGPKATSLGRLARAGLPVPPGFTVTVDAYRDHVADPRIAEAIAAIDTDDPSTTERLRRLIVDRPIRPETAAAIGDAYESIGRPVTAVRSSATAEDLDDASFAGQMDTVLGVSDVDDLLEAVRRCWASLWTDRVVAYRRREGVEDDGLAMAVVVQELVDAETSGVVFTADPVTGSTDTIVVNATWGLGESLVSGDVTPDVVVVDRDARTVASFEIGQKAVETVRRGAETVTVEVDEERRNRLCIDEERAVELSRLASAVEEEYGRHVDVEWAWCDGFHLVQARPITAGAVEREVWNDSLSGDFLWTAGNLGEALPSVMTPMTWSRMSTTVNAVMGVPLVGGHGLTGNIGGRLYLNYTLLRDSSSAIGMAWAMRTSWDLVFGAVPSTVEIPRLPLSRWRILRDVVPATVGLQAEIAKAGRHLEERLEEFPRRCDDAAAAIEAASDLAELDEVWRDRCRPIVTVDAPHLLGAGSRSGGGVLARFEPWLRRHVDAADVGVLASGANGDESGLDSLGPLLALARLARGEIDRAEYARVWGHRSPDEMEVSTPRPAEDPDWIDRRLAALRGGPDPEDLLRRQRERRAEARDRFVAGSPRRARRLDRLMAKTGAALRARERTRSESVRSMWVLRRVALRVGELTGIGDDVFFLSVDEMEGLLRGDRTALDRVPARRAAYAHYSRLPVYPLLINGEFSPERWAADPGRRSDLYDAHARAAVTDDARTVRGAAGSAGVVEGVARVILDVADADALRPGEVLVTKVTNIGWTPVFPHAAAVVTDVGAVLSHAAIVARELGVPAVVGCGSATDRIATGDRVRVDGDTGTVEIL